MKNIKTNEIKCFSCLFQNDENTYQNYSIASSNYFVAHQDFGVPIPGFVIIASKRHIKSIDEFNSEEKINFINFISQLRQTMRQACDIQIIYIIQLEDTAHHFHVWMFPRYKWLIEKFEGNIQSIIPIVKYAKENMNTIEFKNEINKIILKMKKYYKSNFN